MSIQTNALSPHPDTSWLPLQGEERVENRMLTLNWKWMKNWTMSEFIWKWPDWAFCHYGQQQFKRETKFNCKDTHSFSFCPSEYVACEIYSY